MQLTESSTGFDAAESLRYVFVERARCPKCASVNLDRKRSADQGDGSIKRTVNCLQCSHHFYVIEE